MRLFVIMILLLILPAVFLGADEPAESEPVTLTFASWRSEDIQRMNRINKLFQAKNPNIKIYFEPVRDYFYENELLKNLAEGKGPDLFLLRPYRSGRMVYTSGRLAELNELLPELSDFPPAAVKAWTTEDGISYALPSMGYTHGIFYNKEIFKKYNLSEPETWAEFIEVCEVLYEAGEWVFAQGTRDDWTLYEVAYSGLGANFYGGEAARQNLMAGRAKLTDPNFIAAFEAIDSLRKYLPPGHEDLDYISMQHLFATGNAAMYIGGSWEVWIFEDLGADDSEIGWFAPPVVNQGDQLQYCVQVDGGIALNSESKNYEAAVTYLKWLAGPEYAEALMNELPGMYCYNPGDVYIENALARDMRDAAEDAVITIRTLWEKLSDQTPSGNILMDEALPAMMRNEFTPHEAAEYVQTQLESWYEGFAGE